MGPLKILTLILALVLLNVQAVAAYENRKVGALPDDLKGGAHNILNEIILAKFSDSVKSDPVLKFYDFTPDKTALSIKGLNTLDDINGDWTRMLFKCEGMDVRRIGQTIADLNRVEGLSTKTFRDWIIEGGFSADEPEKYMAWRHFYNPVQGKEAYLTDIPAEGSLAGDNIKSWESLMGEPNPRTDAKAWALSHPDNPHNWTIGMKCIDRALQNDDPSGNFASAWRSIGQTLHLIEDMTVPAHVRNDAHPARASWIINALRADAYEAVISADLDIIRRNRDGRVGNEEIARLIDTASGPSSLFNSVAGHVNSHFFSSDTIPYKTRSGAIKDANWDGYVFDRPGIGEAQPRAGYAGNYVSKDEMGDLIMYQESWLNANGWEEKPGVLTRQAVERQAERLIPIAIRSGVKLLHLSIPRLTVGDIDFDRKSLRGKVTHLSSQADGTWKQGEPVNSIMRMIVFMSLGGKHSENLLLPPVQVKDGRFEIKMADLERISYLAARYLNENEPIQVCIGVDLGGILVRSALSSSKEAGKPADKDIMVALHKTSICLIECKGHFVKTDRRENTPPESREYDTIQEFAAPWCRKDLAWNGNSFSLDDGIESDRGDERFKQHEVYTVHVEGQIDPVRKLITNFVYKYRKTDVTKYSSGSPSESKLDLMLEAKSLAFVPADFPDPVYVLFQNHSPKGESEFKCRRTESKKTGKGSFSSETILKNFNDLYLTIKFGFRTSSPFSGG